MNDSSLIRHLLRKDAEHQRVGLLVIWSYALLVPWFPGLYEIHNGTNWNIFYLAPLYGCLILSLIRLIQLDPPGRGIHFLATRPISWKAVLAGKTIFVGLFFFMPLFISKLETVYILGVSFNPLDEALFTVESLIFTAALFSVVALPSFFLRNLLAVLLVLILGVVVVGLVTIVFANEVQGVFSGAYYRNDAQLAACQWLMFEFGLTLTGCAVAVFYYGKRSLPESFGVLGAGLILSGGLLFYWPIKLDEVISGQVFAKVAQPLRDQLHFAVRSGSFSVGSVWKHHADIRNISAEVDLDGLAPPYYAVETDFHAEAPELGLSSSFDWGVANATGLARMQLYDMPNEDVLKKIIAGFPPPTPMQWNHYAFDFFDYPLGLTSHDINWSGKTITGDITLEIRRVVLAQTAPFQVGATFDLPRRHYRWERFVTTHDGIDSHVNMTVKIIPLILRGDFAEGATNLSWLVVNRPQNEYMGANFWGGSPEFFFYGSSRIDSDLQKPGHESGNNRVEWIPEEWARDAEIDVFETESCGRISFPYELNGR